MCVLTVSRHISNSRELTVWEKVFISCKLSQYTHLCSTKFTQIRESFQEAKLPILSCFWLIWRPLVTVHSISNYIKYIHLLFKNILGHTRFNGLQMWFLPFFVIVIIVYINYRNLFVTQYITYLNIWEALSRTLSLSTHDRQWGWGPWKCFLYIQVSDVLCYKPIPIIYRTLLLQIP